MTIEVEIKQQLDKVSDQLREHAEKALSEARKGIDMTEGVKLTVDELKTKQTELMARMDDAEQKAARRGGVDVDAHRTPGAKLVNSDEFKRALADGSLRRKGNNLSVEVKAITSATNSAGVLIAPDRRDGVIEIPRRQMTVRQLLAPGRTSGNTINYFIESGFTNGAAPVAEGTLKPESGMTLTDASAKVIKIAHWMKATTEILDDAPAMQSMIDERLLYGLEYVEELQLLNGSGTGNNLNGLYTQATAYAAPIAIAGATRIDIIRLAMLQGELALLPTTGTVLHPSDWAAIELLKDTTGQYLIGNPQGRIGANLWGQPVVTSMAMAVDTFLTGNFRQAAQIFDREDANIVVSTENQDDFIMNRVTILAEERLALAVYRPAALIKGDMTPA